MKISKKCNSALALISSIVMAISIMASSMVAIMNYSVDKSLIVNADAYSADDGKFSGNEKATDLSDFGGNYLEQNKYKLYCVFRSMGWTKAQACGALGSAACEGSFHSELIEYASADSETGGHTHSEVEGTLGTVKNRDAYIERWSQHVRDPEMRTKFADDTLRFYNIGEDVIERKHNKEEVGSVYSDVVDMPLDVDAYYDKDGNGTIGCGLYQFTGEKNLYRLFNWADSYDMEWYDTDAQISYLIADRNLGGYSGGSVNIKNYQYLCEEAGATTAEKCCEIWIPVIGACNDTGKEDRKTQAAAIYEQFPNDGWDDDYGRKILSYAGIEAVSSRNGILDEGIIQHYVTASVLYPQSCGFIVDTANNQDLYDNNTKVFKEYVENLNGGASTASPTFSLFELFGEDLHWYRYFGESTYTPQLLDHIWSAVDQGKTETLLKHPIDTINYEAYNYLSCQVYPGRPDVLTAEDLDNGDTDPRVLALRNGWFNGYSYVLGNIQMSIAKHFVSLVSFLAGDTVLEETVKVLEKIESSSAWKPISVALMVFVGFAMMAFIISLAKKGMKYANGTGAAKDAIHRFIIGMLCLGFLFAGLANPAILNGVIHKGAGVIDEIFEASLASSLQNDEVIAVHDNDKAVHAVLWKTAIFGPWCRGQFDEREYEELYTQFSTIQSGQSKMPQSHEKVDHADMSGRAFYDSATLTGDVGVPVGGGKVIKNWAAYLYSCGSKYHIDSTLDTEKASKIDTTKEFYFPHASLMTTANNPDIEADLFRIIDAQMNISPQYFVSGSEINNYKDSHKLEPHYLKESSVMIVNSALLLFLVPVLYKKIMSFILLMITIIKMIYGTILELFKENTGLSEFTKLLKKHFFDYMVACLKLCILVTLYYMFVDQGFIKMAIYCVLCLVVLGFNFKDARKFTRNAKHKIQRIKSHGL